MSSPVCVVVGIGPKNGAAFSRHFSAQGYSVALLSRSTGLSGALAEELGSAKAYACDVADPESVGRAIAAVEVELGPVDTLVFNAGSGSWGTLDEISAETFATSWRVNALGLFHVAKAVTPGMTERGVGNIVVVGATASLRGKPFTTAFAPAKAAQRSLAQALARHLAPKGVHVSLMIIDGMIGEPGSGSGSGSEDPPKRLDPEDIAKAAYFLATQPASAWTFELDLRPRMENW